MGFFGFLFGFFFLVFFGWSSLSSSVILRVYYHYSGISVESVTPAPWGVADQVRRPVPRGSVRLLPRPVWFGFLSFLVIFNTVKSNAKLKED